MLSVLPPYDRPRERETERSFKAISSRALQHHHNSSPYYSPFSSTANSYLGSFPANNTSTSSSNLGKQESAMDLRPPQMPGMYDHLHHPHPQHQRGYGDGMVDMTSHMTHRNMQQNVKQESSHQMQQPQQQQSHPAMSYPNMNTAHSNGYTNLSSTIAMPSLRDMGSPPQATLPTLGENANSPPQSSTSNINANNSTSRLPGLEGSPEPSPSESSISLSPPGLQLPTTIVGNPQPTGTSSLTSSSIAMPPKKRPISVPDKMKDNSYWEKRKKNNESARRSRETRRMKEEHVAVRVVYLEQENLQLRTEVSLLKSEVEKLRCMLYNS